MYYVSYNYNMYYVSYSYNMYYVSYSYNMYYGPVIFLSAGDHICPLGQVQDAVYQITLKRSVLNNGNRLQIDQIVIKNITTQTTINLINFIMILLWQDCIFSHQMFLSQVAAMSVTGVGRSWHHLFRFPNFN